MNGARLNFDGREIKIGEETTTIGRASDNDISFLSDSNVSRYHAEIKIRNGQYWLSDLGSSNGTTVNGQRVVRAVLLNDGDRIVLGGSSEVVFTTAAVEEDEPAEEATAGAAAGAGRDSPADEAETGGEAAEPTEQGAEEATAHKPAKMNWLVGCAGITFGLALIAVVAAVLFNQCGGPPPETVCSPKVKIISPSIGETIEKKTPVKIRMDEFDCITHVLVSIDGKKIREIEVEESGFEEATLTAELDPNQFPDLSDGWPHTIRVALKDDKGGVIEDADELPEIYLETREIEVARTEPEGGNGEDSTGEETGGTEPTGTETTSIIELNQLARQVIAGLPANSRFAPDQDFLQAVQKLIPEYTTPGYFARAEKYRDVINEAYIKERDLNPSLGYLLAMSQTKFDLANKKNGEGLWDMPADFVSRNNFNAGCAEGASLSEPTQNCAAKASSEYMKALVETVFDGDIIYSVATFGKPPQRALERKAALPPDKKNFWPLLSRHERDQVARFFAAAIVTENPKKFGLDGDRPLSELYKFGSAN